MSLETKSINKQLLKALNMYSGNFKTWTIQNVQQYDYFKQIYIKKSVQKSN